MVGAMEIYMLLPKTNCKKCGLPAQATPQGMPA